MEVSTFDGSAVNARELHLEEDVEPITMEIVNSGRGVHEEVVNGGLYTTR